MILAPHMLAGAALATSIHQPALLALSAIALHYLLDVVPHWEYDIVTSRKAAAYKITVDIACGLFILLLALRHLAPSQQALVLWGGFFGIVPDGLLAISLFSQGKYLRRITLFHTFWHTRIVPLKTHPPLWLGITAEAIVIAVSLFMLLR